MEIGIVNFGIWEIKFLLGVMVFSQVFWGSIGWFVGVCQGVVFVVKDLGSDWRIIFFVGDGLFQFIV